MSDLLGGIDEARVRAIAALAEQLGLAELELQDGELRVRVVRALGPTVGVSPVRTVMASAVPSSTVAAPNEARPSPTPSGVLVRAPMAGTFYRAPAPGQPVFVDVGSEVGVDSVLCIIESMKMMNRIEAERVGRIAAVLVNNGDRVQAGQPLFSLVD